jgi:hypothetical protein
MGSACDQKPLLTTDTPARLVERGEFVHSGGQFHISYEHGEKVSNYIRWFQSIVMNLNPY